MNSGGAAGDTVGSVQGEEVISHAHTYGISDGSLGGVTDQGLGRLPRSSNGITDSVGGSETRPTNAAVNYIIKI